MNDAARPRALCVRARPSPASPPFMERLLDEWIRALALHADLQVMTEDFDLAEACDTHQPDFIVFEGLSTLRPLPLRIASPAACAAIPRAVFLNVDPHDAMRPHIYRMVEAFGIEAIFAYDSNHEEQMPELAGMTYSASMPIDPAIHREYGLEKLIPISVFGGFAEPRFYAWRAATIPRLQARFPTFVHTHPGYRKSATHPFAVHGERYARQLNRSWFSLADSTRLDYVVRKHLEIPACGAVVIAPDSAALADYGLADMATCVTGSGSELLDKIAAVAADPALYEGIRQAGQRLVLDRHTPQRWRAITDWFAQRRRATPGEMVVQQGMFGPFHLVPALPGTPRCAAMPNRPNEVTAILRAARTALLTGNCLDASESRLREAASWLAHLTEPWLLLGVIALLRGDGVEARRCLLRPSAIQFQRHAPHIAAEDARVCFDPVELAFLLLTATLLDDAALMRLAYEQARDVDHLALRRMLRLLDEAPEDPSDTRRPGDRPSIHWLGQETPDEWRGLIARIFHAHGGVGAPRYLELAG